MTWVRTDHIPNEQPHDPLEASPPFPEHQTLWQNSDLRIRVGQTREQPSPAQLPGTTPNVVQMRSLRFRMAPVTQQHRGESGPHTACLPITPQLGPGLLCPPQKRSGTSSGSYGEWQEASLSYPGTGVWAGARASRRHTGSVASWSCAPVGPQKLSSGLAGHACPRPGCGGYLLGTRLMARRGRSTRTVRMAERLTLCPSREYSIMLGAGQRERGLRRPTGALGTEPGQRAHGSLQGTLPAEARRPGQVSTCQRPDLHTMHPAWLGSRAGEA